MNVEMRNSLDFANETAIAAKQILHPRLSSIIVDTGFQVLFACAVRARELSIGRVCIHACIFSRPQCLVAERTLGAVNLVARNLLVMLEIDGIDDKPKIQFRSDQIPAQIFSDFLLLALAHTHAFALFRDEIDQQVNRFFYAFDAARHMQILFRIL